MEPKTLKEIALRSIMGRPNFHKHLLMYESKRLNGEQNIFHFERHSRCNYALINKSESCDLIDLIRNKHDYLLNIYEDIAQDEYRLDAEVMMGIIDDVTAQTQECEGTDLEKAKKQDKYVQTDENVSESATANLDFNIEKLKETVPDAPSELTEIIEAKLGHKSAGPFKQQEPELDARTEEHLLNIGRPDVCSSNQPNDEVYSTNDLENEDYLLNLPQQNSNICHHVDEHDPKISVEELSESDLLKLDLEKEMSRKENSDSLEEKITVIEKGSNIYLEQDNIYIKSDQVQNSVLLENEKISNIGEVSGFHLQKEDKRKKEMNQEQNSDNPENNRKEETSRKLVLAEVFIETELQQEVHEVLKVLSAELYEAIVGTSERKIDAIPSTPNNELESFSEINGEVSDLIESFVEDLSAEESYHSYTIENLRVLETIEEVDESISYDDLSGMAPSSDDESPFTFSQFARATDGDKNKCEDIEILPNLNTDDGDDDKSCFKEDLKLNSRIKDLYYIDPEKFQSSEVLTFIEAIRDDKGTPRKLQNTDSTEISKADLLSSAEDLCELSALSEDEIPLTISSLMGMYSTEEEHSEEMKLLNSDIEDLPQRDSIINRPEGIYPTCTENDHNFAFLTLLEANKAEKENLEDMNTLPQPRRNELSSLDGGDSTTFSSIAGSIDTDNSDVEEMATLPTPNRESLPDAALENDRLTGLITITKNFIRDIFNLFS